MGGLKATMAIKKQFHNTAQINLSKIEVQGLYDT